MFILDCVVSRGNNHEYMSGSIYRAPPELVGQAKIDKYSKYTKPGWYTIDYGYRAYVINGSNQTTYCFIGLLPKDINHRNIYKLPVELREDRIIEYFKSIGSMEAQFLNNVRDDLNLVIHDLRRLSNVIYNAAELAKLTVSNINGANNAVTLIDNIIAAQNMLKIRVDMLDYTEDTRRIMVTKQVPVYKKIHKVVRSFRPAAEKQSISIHLVGESFKTSDGPDILEIVPYILIDNAVKYSPHNGAVDVKVLEKEGYISFSVKSIGPIIEPDEYELIFERGYRGKATDKIKDSGSGLGLFLCKSIVERFNGRISIQSGNRDIETGKGICREHSFIVDLPITTAS